MNQTTAQEIFDAKAERRKRLAALSIDEKIDIIEKLHELGRDMIAARATLPKPPIHGDSK